MTLQRRTELALRALRALGATRGTVSGAALASRIETTPTYLPQVMAPLVGAGWVASGRGPNGGYALRESARRISMLELIDASEGSIPSDRCVLRGGPCGHGPHCAMHDSWQQAQAALGRERDGIPVFEPAHRKE